MRKVSSQRRVISFLESDSSQSLPSRHVPPLLRRAVPPTHTPSFPLLHMKTRPILSRSISTFLALGAMSLPQIAKATSDIWDGSVDGLWSNSGNWLTDPLAVPGTGDLATFSGLGNG